ncbi:hypothetical protein H310_10765 [Aphanomyces invadans]|uniref:Uncharacterized protein n=1 Tax=Aphanomyces invadans TaxID=157072 RepID=A0A024TRZ7_9STRA|nr:hypothetical protein H310_10765 [Aphanomyces invadans]ETV96132.1 hypothetical protein H310_10765 [Aphanomyces invadans]|eukprot:XP_008875443.1 hypothetical protein H310_10765 [Aphanomyces invadans]
MHATLPRPPPPAFSLRNNANGTMVNASVQERIVPTITQGDFTPAVPVTMETSDSQSMNVAIVLIAIVFVAVAAGLFLVLFRRHQPDPSRPPSVCLSKSRYGGVNFMSVFDTYACGAHIMLHSPEGTMREPSIVLGAVGGRVDEWCKSHESTATGEFDINVVESSDHTSFKL